MDRTKILKKQERSSRHTRSKFSAHNIKPIKLKKKKGITPFQSQAILQNKKLIVQAILESFQDNDPDAILEILDAHVRSINKSEFAANSGISRSTLYDMLQGNKNPTLRVLTHCIHEMLESAL